MSLRLPEPWTKADTWTIGAVYVQRGWWRWKRRETWCLDCAKRASCMGNPNIVDVLPMDVAQSMAIDSSLGGVTCDSCGEDVIALDKYIKQWLPRGWGVDYCAR